ncbi:MAG: alpha/beta hydrolase fold domain-containing protein [Actinobacteria bacterium]|nr:alpha/beta hydrolase fold domain-containing protein [Actinomycetota bacterium]
MGAIARLEAGAAAITLGLTPRVLRALGGRQVVIDGQRLEPETAVILRLARLSGREDVTTLTVSEARERIRRSAASVAGAPLPLAAVEEHSVAGADGPLGARLYVPAEAGGPGSWPLLVFFHGGGWVVGDLDTHDALCRRLAVTSGARVLAVDYRLAPEHRFPAAADDALAAFLDVARDPDRFGADATRIAVGGDSAGGNLSAVVALEARTLGGPVPAFQLLIYPATDSVARDRPSQVFFDEGFFLTGSGMAWYRGHYFGPQEPQLAPDPRASPLLAPDLAGLAPAHIVTAGFDPLRDEGEAYAARLRDAGVAVTLRRHAGLIHGFANMLGAGRVGREAVIEMGGVLRHGLHVG